MRHSTLRHTVKEHSVSSYAECCSFLFDMLSAVKLGVVVLIVATPFVIALLHMIIMSKVPNWKLVFIQGTLTERECLSTFDLFLNISCFVMKKSIVSV
jgi:hypothetical protein